jgi:hypothetical protein
MMKVEQRGLTSTVLPPKRAKKAVAARAAQVDAVAANPLKTLNLKTLWLTAGAFFLLPIKSPNRFV